MNDLKSKIKQRRQEIQPVDILKAENNQTDRTDERPGDQPTVSNTEKSIRQSVRVSYQFYADQYPAMLEIQEYYSKKKGRKIPLSFFTKRAFDEYIARCRAKIAEEREKSKATDRTNG